MNDPNIISALARGIHQRHVAMATAKYGAKVPKPNAAVASVDANTLARFADLDRARAKATKAAETKASWSKVVARQNKAVQAPSEPSRQGAATATWAKAIAKANAGHRS